MTTYRYRGQTKDGTAVSGVIRAYDEFEAASRLRETVALSPGWRRCGRRRKTSSTAPSA